MVAGEGVLFLTLLISTAHFCYLLAQEEEGEDCTLSVYRQLHNSLDPSELPGKQGLPEPGRVRAEEQLRPTRPCAEEN